jgi:WhiB family redox-sensing transcriptional regulator
MAMTLAAYDPPPADPHAWRALAACRGIETDEFYPDSPSELTVVAAQTCTGCLVRTDCLMWGVEHEDHGIWGGLTEAQRARMRKAAGIRLDSPQSHFPVGAHHDPEDPPYEEPEEEPDPWR